MKNKFYHIIEDVKTKNQKNFDKVNKALDNKFKLK